MHDPGYVEKIKALSADDSKGYHESGDCARFAPGGYEICALAAGGAITAAEAVLRGDMRNAYVLTRPPGAWVAAACLHGRPGGWAGC